MTAGRRGLSTRRGVIRRCPALTRPPRQRGHPPPQAQVARGPAGASVRVAMAGGTLGFLGARALLRPGPALRPGAVPLLAMEARPFTVPRTA